ncbi:hypothetical protein [Fredinandcohnia sp. 179-A 10B2 NHS]|uniref:hypothetical protein n=1 Tax=Fredinandcohnia sp. 179-A 10B2 NHS TaxID=3235176 RepID=UPI00399FD02B
MKKHLGIIFTVFALLMTLVTPQVSKASASTLNTISVTVGGEEYIVESDANNHYLLDVDQFVTEHAIDESEKLEKISVTPAEGATSVYFNFGTLSGIVLEKEVQIETNKVEFEVSELLGDYDKGSDGVAISNLRQLLYPVGNTVDAAVTVNYENGSSEELTFTLTQDYAPSIPDGELVTLDKITLVTSNGNIDLVGSDNVFSWNMLELEDFTKVTAVELYSETATKASIFTKDSYLNRELTDITFVDGKATLDSAKLQVLYGELPETAKDELADEFGLEDADLDYLVTVGELRYLFQNHLADTLHGFVYDENSNESEVTLTVSNTGWKLSDEKEWHYITDFAGTHYVGWLLDGGKWYYLDPKQDGAMYEGWFWNGSYYYLTPGSGHMHEGWLTYKGGKYYLTPKTGAMVTGNQKIGNKAYIFKTDGSMYSKTGWNLINGKWYYITNDGSLKTGWVYDKGYYLFNADGQMLTGWQKDNGKWYFLNSSGLMQTGWLQQGKTWYLLSKDGAMKTGWTLDGNTWYYFTKDGYMSTGWVDVNGTWYLLGANGAMKTGWALSGNTWYYLAPSGAMKTGWIYTDAWYYLGSNGAMKTGWQLIGGNWYYLYSNGKMAANTKIGGYIIGADGVWKN